MALRDNLIVCYEFESGALLVDATPNAKTLTNVTNATSDADGKVGNAARLQGDYFTRADDSDLSTGNVDYSIAVWVKRISLPGTGVTYTVASKFLSADREWLLDITENAGNYDLRFLIQKADNSGNVSVTKQIPIGDAAFHYIAAIHVAGTGLKLSTDAGTFSTTSWTSGGRDSASDLWIGNRPDIGNATLANLLVDQFLFYKRDITSDVAALYNSNNGLSYAAMAPAGGQLFRYSNLDGLQSGGPFFNDPLGG